jgi:hypothetical protein
MDVRSQLVELLSEPRFHDGSNDDPDDEILAITENIGWDPTFVAFISILEDESLVLCWYDSIAFLFGCDCHKRDLPCERSYLTALLYDCLRLHPDLGVKGLEYDGADNLVWSIVHALKGVEYLSDYDPKSDPEVLRQVIDR